jgi:hypothetical protein
MSVVVGFDHLFPLLRLSRYVIHIIRLEPSLQGRSDASSALEFGGSDPIRHA